MSKVFVICGPAGVGKGTVVSNLMARYPDLFLSISMTTRPPRTGETNGIHYHFVDDKKFDELVLSLIHISEPTRREWLSRMPSSA